MNPFAGKMKYRIFKKNPENFNNDPPGKTFAIVFVILAF